MRFGIVFEHQLPRPWADGAEERIVHEALDQVELADGLGYDSVWAVERHFAEEHAHSAAPGLFLAAASQRSRRLRLGFADTPLPPAFAHPARVAERIATLDLLSGGRCEAGTGEGAGGAELGGLGADRDSRREQWAEMLDVLARMMVEEPFAGADGRFLTMPARNVVPKPVQRPHPPLWVACTRRETIRLAAEKGVGALSFSLAEPEEAAEWVDEYEGIIASERCVPAGFAVNPSVAVVLPMHVHADEGEAIARGIDGAHFHAYALAHYDVFGEHRPGLTNLHAEFAERREEVGLSRAVVTADGAPLSARILRGGLGSLRGAIGTPAQVAALLRRYEDAGVAQVILRVQAGGVRHEHVCEALELFAAEVMPEFAARRDDHERARAERLAPAVAEALARRQPPRRADPRAVFSATASGPPARAPGAPGTAPANVAATPSVAVRARALAAARGGRAFASFVRRSDDRRLERTVGSERGLRFMFEQLAGRFSPAHAGGFSGDLEYALHRADATESRWTIAVAGDRATARPGGSLDPVVTMKLSVADFVRMAARELDPGRALLDGRLDLEGDFATAARMGEMFGAPPAT